MNNFQLSHLKELESESIFIIREVAAQFENPQETYLNVRVPSLNIYIS